MEKRPVKEKSGLKSKIGFSAKIGSVFSLLYISSGGACPCCGAPTTTCFIGLASAGILGGIASVLSFFTEKFSYLRAKLSKVIRKQTTQQM